MLVIVETEKIIAGHPHIAWGFLDRARGMILRQFSAKLDAMVFYRCSAIHMYFMSSNIDVLFLDREHKILKMVPQVRPWKSYVGCRSAATTIELPAGSIAKYSIALGNHVNICETEQKESSLETIRSGRRVQVSAVNEKGVESL